MIRRIVGCVVLMGCASLASWCGGQTTQPASTDVGQLQQRVEDLQGQVTDLRQQLNAVAASTQPTPSPTKGEPPRAPALWDVAGYTLQKGFYIRTPDGNFLLHPWAFLQARDTYSYRSIAPNGTHDSENGLELPRAKFILDGNIFNKDLTYQLIWATSDTTGNLGLQDAWGRYHIPGTLIALEGGNIRDPVDHEQLLFATRSLTPERSIVNNVLLNGDDIVKGAEVSVGFDDPVPLRGEVAYTGGERDFDTTFQDYPTNPASWGVSGRAEWKLMGKWEDYNQFSAYNDKENLLVAGLGADYTEGGGTAGLTHVVDVQFNTPNHVLLYAAYLGRYVKHNAGLPSTNGNPTTAGAASTDTYDATVRVMAAYLMAKRFEPFVRYEYLHLDPRVFATPTNYDINDITAGFNVYFYGQRAKATLGATYLPQGSPLTNTLGDLLPTHRGSEVVVQTQVQLIF